MATIETKGPKDFPHHVVGVEGEKQNYVKGFMKKEKAVGDAGDRNIKAKEMGIETRYKVVARGE